MGKQRRREKQPGLTVQRDKKDQPAPLALKQSGKQATGEGGSSSVALVGTHKKGIRRPKYTPEQIIRKKAHFIEAMAGGAFSPSTSAEIAGIGTSTAFRWKNQDPEFAAEWDAAVDKCLDRIETRLQEIALELNQPHKVTAAMFLLNGYRRERFMPMTRHEHTGPGGGPILHAVAAKIKNMDTEELRAELGKLLGSALVEVKDPKM